MKEIALEVDAMYEQFEKGMTETWISYERALGRQMDRQLFARLVAYA